MLISLDGINKGLEQGDIVTEQEQMSFYGIKEKFSAGKPKLVKQLKIIDMFGVNTKNKIQV